jgi:CheY-like chemotaxis protein
MGKLKKIILVDDDETSNFLNNLLIRQLNIFEKVEIVKNGKEALHIVNSYQEIDLPEVILLDINMPVMDGFEFLEEFYKLKKLNSTKTKVIILTSSDSNKDLERAKSFNIAGYINKPLTKEKLEKIFKNAS